MGLYAPSSANNVAKDGLAGSEFGVEQAVPSTLSIGSITSQEGVLPIILAPGCALAAIF